MKQIFDIAIFVFVFPFSVLAETSVEGLLDKVDRLYRSDSSHATMEIKIVTDLASGIKSSMQTEKNYEFGDTPNSFQLIIKHYR